MISLPNIWLRENTWTSRPVHQVTKNEPFEVQNMPLLDLLTYYSVCNIYYQFEFPKNVLQMGLSLKPAYILEAINSKH